MVNSRCPVQSGLLRVVIKWKSQLNQSYFSIQVDFSRYFLIFKTKHHCYHLNHFCYWLHFNLKSSKIYTTLNSHTFFLKICDLCFVVKTVFFLLTPHFIIWGYHNTFHLATFPRNTPHVKNVFTSNWCILILGGTSSQSLSCSFYTLIL